MRDKSNQLRDKHLWDGIGRGDSTAFKRLYESQYQDMFAFGYGIIADRDAIKDSIQDLFLELWNKRSNLPEVKNHSAYLKQILKHKLFKKLKDRAKIRLTKESTPTFSNSYETLLIKQQSSLEEQEKLRNAFQQLSTKQREVIQLRFYKGLSYEEIAELSNTQKRTIYNQMHSALKVLKKAMLLHLFFNNLMQ